VLCNGGARPIVRKKAALALLRLFRRNPEILDPAVFAGKLADLLDERDLGILSGVMSLLTGILSHDHRGYEVCVPKVCAVLTRLARNKDIPADYQVRLGAFPNPTHTFCRDKTFDLFFPNRSTTYSPRLGYK
jgi:AP-2 complex subunit alpha